jgi:hypothetical protein
MRKKILEKRLARLQSKKQSLTERAMSSQDVNEVRTINNELEDVNAEIAETQEELDAIAEEERQAELEAEKRAANPVPADAKLVNGEIRGNVVGAFKAPEARDNEDLFLEMPQDFSVSSLNFLYYFDSFNISIFQ